jgi:hypothetical protein
LAKLSWWAGVTHQKPPAGADLGDPKFRFGEACVLVAGEIAEQFCDEPLPPNDRRGEFNPEMFHAVELVAAIAAVTGQDPEALFDQLLETTAALLEDHFDHLQALAERLLHAPKLRGGALQKLLPPPEPAEITGVAHEAPDALPMAA